MAERFWPVPRLCLRSTDQGNTPEGLDRRWLDTGPRLCGLGCVAVELVRITTWWLDHFLDNVGLRLELCGLVVSACYAQGRMV